MITEYSIWADGSNPSTNPLDKLYGFRLFAKVPRNIPLIGRFFPEWREVPKIELEIYKLCEAINLCPHTGGINRELLRLAVNEDFRTLYEQHKHLVTNDVGKAYVNNLFREFPTNDLLIEHLQKDLPQLYKVLSLQNTSMNGGIYEWKLGVKTEVVDDPALCSKGYHLTTDPLVWASEPCRVYKAKGYGYVEHREDKYVFRSAMITEELPAGYWFNLFHHLNYFVKYPKSSHIRLAEMGLTTEVLDWDAGRNYIEDFGYHKLEPIFEEFYRQCTK